jgi:hypothetical protein
MRKIKRFTVRERKCQYCNKAYWTPDSLEECEKGCKKKKDIADKQAACEHTVGLIQIDEEGCSHCSSRRTGRYELWTRCTKCDKVIEKTISIDDIPNSMLKEILLK